MNTTPHCPTFSFLVPTRSNVEMLGNFLDSIMDTTRRMDCLEVVLCVDSDDEVMLHYEHPGVPCVRTVAPPGSTMGQLNNRCFEASSGDYVMLLNDDVILRTAGWDMLVEEALAPFSGSHLLVHVNDLIFGSSLCTFPLLSRKTVLQVGLCPEGFRRYGIDDHIMDIFHILRSLGHDRIHYMADVIFEHLNYCVKAQDGAARSYVPRTSPAFDWDLFKRFLPLRKEAALALAMDIDGHDENEARYQDRLALVTSDKSYRKIEPLCLSERPSIGSDPCAGNV